MIPLGNTGYHQHHFATIASTTRNRAVLLQLTRLICLLLFLGLAGGATTMKLVEIEYLPNPTRDPAISNARLYSIHVNQFSDIRIEADPRIIGEAKTGIANRSTPLVISNNLDSMVTGYFKEALIELGFILLETEEADLVFKGRINKFWLQEFANGYSQEYCEGRVELDVAVFARGQSDPLWYDVKSSIVTSATNPIDITDKDEGIINEALNKATDMIIADSQFIAVLNKYCVPLESQ